MSQRPARSVYLPAGGGIVHRVFAAGAAGKRVGFDFAGLAQAETEGRIAGIGLDQYTLSMACSANIGHAEDRFRAGLALDREHPFFGIRDAVMHVIAGNSADGLIGAPVNAGVGFAARGVERSK